MSEFPYRDCVFLPNSSSVSFYKPCSAMCVFRSLIAVLLCPNVCPLTQVVEKKNLGLMEEQIRETKRLNSYAHMVAGLEHQNQALGLLHTLCWMF